MPSLPQKEFLPSLERWGVWVPGSVGGYFRSVDAWKEVSSLNQFPRDIEPNTQTVRHGSHPKLPHARDENTIPQHGFDWKRWLPRPTADGFRAGRREHGWHVRRKRHHREYICVSAVGDFEATRLSETIEEGIARCVSRR